MTDTIARPAAADAAADFLPLKGIDHVEFWVGNAKQAAAYYRALWGLHPRRLRGPRDGRA
jgi:4-hydroxyphenylpyruvate dioxygenase